MLENSERQLKSNNIPNNHAKLEFAFEIPVRMRACSATVPAELSWGRVISDWGAISEQSRTHAKAFQNLSHEAQGAILEL